MTKDEKLKEIQKYLSNEAPYHRIPDVNQYTHFITGVFIVQAKNNLRFAPKFFKWLDDNEIRKVSLCSVLDGAVYSIVVEED